MKMKIDEIELDEDIYPRKQRSQKRIESYQESLKAGAKFPPILVQKVIDKECKKTIVLDGVHRVTSHENENREEIEAIYWKDETLDKSKPEILEELRIVATQKNMEHGVPLTEGDIEFQCIRIADARPIEKLTGVQKYLAQKLGVTEGYMSQMVGALVNRRKASRDSIILRLSMLGWSNVEIGNILEMTPQNVGQIEKKFNTKEIFDSFQQGKTIEEIASYYNLDQTLTWAIVLQGKTDKERLTLLSEKVDDLVCKPRPYDVWNFASPHPLMGHEYPGRIPGQIILQMLYFYTKQGDLLVDPMAGSGTVIDACLLMNRRCKAYDINPPEERKDILQSDAIESIKILKKKVNLFFLDPPYFKKKEKEYGEKSISSLTRDEYLGYFNRLANICKEKLAPNGRVALLMSDYTEDDPSKSIFIHPYIRLFEEIGFIVERINFCPLSSQQIHPDFIIKYTDARKQCRLVRYLVIFREAEPK